MGSDVKTATVTTNRTFRLAFLTAGYLLVGIGILGIFLPLLPTTIFFILASYCFMKSSPQLAEKLKNHPWLGSYLRNYQDKTGLTVASKVGHITVLWLGIGLSAIYLTDILAVRIILLVIAVSVTIHLLTIKTQRK